MEVTRECKTYKEILLPDEQVEWSGRPEKTPLLSAEIKTGILSRWITSAVIFVILTVLYAAIISRSNAQFNIIVVLVLAAVFICIAIAPIQDWNALQKSVNYYVTNKRVILISKKTAYALNLSGLNRKVIPAGENTVHVLFGSCTEIAGKKCRRFTIMPETDDNNPSKNGFVFYAVREGKSELEKLLFLS